jgi:hypothetical protein
MAHEIGHLLPGRHSHSREGIMAVAWTSSSLALTASGKLFFTSKEAKRIQAQMANRTGAAQISH